MTLTRPVWTSCLALLLLAACSHFHPAEPAPPLILVSLDGFRADYLGREGASHLRQMAAQGVRAEAMRPSFPSTTFPNHYTIVTGLWPDRHGVVGNTMEDASIPGERFSLSNDKAMQDARWFGQAEPVWVTAEKRGIATANVFWPGSQAPIHGVLARDHLKYDVKMTAEARVDAVLGWLDKPVAQRPAFVALYLEDLDHAGHDFGPDSVQLAEALARVDAAMDRLMRGLQQRGIAANVVITSDHGMTAVSQQRVIALDRIAPAQSYRVVTSWAYAGIEPLPGKEEELAAALRKPQEHMQCWAKADIPARFHYGQNARVPAYICLPETGWVIAAKSDSTLKNKGNHGYDNLAPDMQGLFIATGPAFKPGVVLPAFDNVHVYPLLMKLLGIPALPSNGSPDPTASALK